MAPPDPRANKVRTNVIEVTTTQTSTIVAEPHRRKADLIHVNSREETAYVAKIPRTTGSLDLRNVNFGIVFLVESWATT